MRTLIFILCLAVATPAIADGVSAARSWIAELEATGYTDIEESRTWLWRIRITAERGDTLREIILDRTTGEVLRDISRAEDGDIRHPYEDDDDDDDVGDAGGDEGAGDDHDDVGDAGDDEGAGDDNDDGDEDGDND